MVADSVIDSESERSDTEDATSTQTKGSGASSSGKLSDIAEEKDEYAMMDDAFDADKIELDNVKAFSENKAMDSAMQGIASLNVG